MAVHDSQQQASTSHTTKRDLSSQFANLPQGDIDPPVRESSSRSIAIGPRHCVIDTLMSVLGARPIASNCVSRATESPLSALDEHPCSLDRSISALDAGITAMNWSASAIDRRHTASSPRLTPMD